MRRGIIIGVMAAVIGVMAFWVSQPKRGSVEWNKRAYLDAWKRLNQQTLADKAKQFFCRITGRKQPARRWSVDDVEGLQTHRAALLASGYLSQQSFDLTNCSPNQVFSSPAFASARRRAHREFLMIIGQGPNGLHVIAVAKEVPLFTEAVRKAEVPENGN